MRVEAGIHGTKGHEGANEQRGANQQNQCKDTSLITSSERALLWRNPVPDRLLLSLSVEFKSVREALSAGRAQREFR